MNAVNDNTMEGPTDFHQCDEFTQGYIRCALWLFDDEPGSGDWDREDVFLSSLAPDAIKAMAKDCADFQKMCAHSLSDVYEEGYDASRAGYDFWLTRAGHGAGFWDRGLGAAGDYLTEIAHGYGDTDLYRGDDNLIYVS